MTAARVVIDAHADLSRRYREHDIDVIRYMTGFAQDVQERDQRRYNAMFFPYEPTVAGMAKMMGSFGRDLFDARTYQITAEIMHVLQQYHATGAKPVEVLSEAELPVEAGFVWFDEPLQHHDIQGRVSAIRAVTWARSAVQLVLTPGSEGYRTEGTPRTPRRGENHELVAALRLTWYSHRDDPDDYHDWLHYPDAEDFLSRLPALTIVHTTLIPFGYDISTAVDEEERWKNRPFQDSLIAFAHAMWAFMEMEITATRREAQPRGVRRRVEKSLRHTDVSIITLRRVHHTEPAVTSRVVDWSCRWIVSAFYRHIEPYTGAKHSAQPRGKGQHPRCVVCGAKTTYVRPYIKGPDHLPLKTADQLYRVAR